MIRVVVRRGLSLQKPEEITARPKSGVRKEESRFDSNAPTIKDEPSIGLPTHPEVAQHESISFGQAINESSVPRNPETPTRRVPAWVL